MSATKILWTHWCAEERELGGTLSMDDSEIGDLVEQVAKDPKAFIRYGRDTEGDKFICLISGDGSDEAITKALDKRFFGREVKIDDPV